MERELDAWDAERRRREQALQEAEAIRRRLRRRGVPESQLGSPVITLQGRALSVDDVLKDLPTAR